MPAWTPTAPYLNRSRLKAFAAAHGHKEYGSLLRWSQTDLDGFWRAVDRDLDLVWTKKTTFHTVVTPRGGYYDLRTSLDAKHSATP